MERSLDLSVVRAVVRDASAECGWPSIDPVVFKLQQVMFFGWIRSERQPMRMVADRLSLRWYLDDDLAEPQPGHSSFTRIREAIRLRLRRRRLLLPGWPEGAFPQAQAHRADADLLRPSRP